MRSAIRLTIGLALGLAFLAVSVQAQPIICSSRWCRPYFYDVGSGPTGIAVGDFDADRWTDMAVAVKGGDKISILTNSGNADAKFDPPFDIPLDAGSAPHSVLAIDIDNDSDLDLVVSRSGTDDIQLLTNVAGVFSLGAITAAGGSLPSEIVAGDLDGNGFTDIVTSNRDSNDVSVMLNTAGVLAAGVPHAVGAGPRGLALSDFDGGGSLDLAVASTDTGVVEIHLNDGTGSFTLDSSLPVGSGLNPNGGVAAADFDEDGNIDVAATTSGSAGDFATVFLNDGSASFGPPDHFRTDDFHPINPTGDPSSLIAGDLDLDGDVDLALTNLASSKMANLLGQGTGAFSPPLLVGDKETPDSLVAGDLDGNGSDDLVTANLDSDNVGVMINTVVFFADGFEWGDTWAWSAEVPEAPDP